MSNNAPFVPWMHSLLDRMKELYNKPNARTIAEALPDITGAITVDSALSTTSENPVQNKVIKAALDGKDGNKTYICTNFDSAETYAVGDYVMYSSALYECTTAHTGAWNASHFTAVTLNEGDLICNTDEKSSVAWSDITGKPTTLAGYGITDAEAKGKITINGTQKAASSHTLSWTDNGTTYSYEVVTV